MSSGTSILRNEHELILKMLDVADTVAGRLDQGAAVTPDTLSGILEFLRLFADRSHHGKEEDLLFPLLENKGIPRRGGPIGIMLQEHDMGRALIQDMVAASDEYARGGAGSGNRWAKSAREYTALLRAHIDKENNILFVMADNVLSASEQQQLAGHFEKVQTEKLGAGHYERLQSSAEKLAAEILPV